MDCDGASRSIAACLLAPLLQAIHRVIAGFLVKRAGFKLSRADTGAVTLIQRFGSAANLNIHLHCLVLDGVYLNRDGVPVFHEAAAPTAEEQTLLLNIIAPIMRLLTAQGFLIEEQDMTYLAEADTDRARGTRGQWTALRARYSEPPRSCWLYCQNDSD